MADTANPKRVAIACQGGGSHAAYVAGALQGLLRRLGGGYTIAGLSGTSGGAHCALVAWYWILREGIGENTWRYERAIDRLAGFWHENAPEGLFEEVWNSWAVQLAALPVEVAASPYQPPLSIAEKLLGLWQRKEFVNMAALLRHWVSFDDIRAIGEFQRLAGEAQRIRYAQEARDLAIFGQAPGQDTLANLIGQLQNRSLAANTVVQQMRGFAACKRHIARANEEIQRSKTIQQIDQALAALSTQIPFLLLGAVNVTDGSFKAFDSRRGEITLEAVLASAAVPWIFQAVEVGGKPHWDGLFSQNPPVRDFVSGADTLEQRPDEIWVLQINPQRCDGVPKTASGIADRRNELTCNLSLNQEVESLKSVNRWLIKGALADPKRKIIHLHRIRMHSPTLEARLGHPLDTSSKIERSRIFIDTLMEHGAEQAELFWPVRQLIEQAWNCFPDGKTWSAEGLGLLDTLIADGCRVELPAQIGDAASGVEMSWSPPGPLDSRAQIRRAIEECQRSALPNMRVIVEDMDIQPDEVRNGSGKVVLWWQAHALRAAHMLTLSGAAHLTITRGIITRAAITSISITAIKPYAQPKPQQPADQPSAPPPGDEQHKAVGEH